MKRRVWLILLAVVILAGGFYAFFGRGAEEGPEEVPISAEDATLQFVRPTIVGMLEGVRQWELVAERMRERDGIIYLDDIEPGQLYREGDEYLAFTATNGVWTQAKDTLELQGDVKVYHEGELLLATERLVWDGRSEILTAPEAVQIHHDGYTIRAARMTGYVKEDRLVFQENVEVVSDRLVLRVPGELTYHVEDGSMSGLGSGILEFRAGNQNVEGEEKGNEA